MMFGHTPFGHKGEYILNEICKKEKIGYFKHNAQSVRLLKDIEKVNISMQTLDGILAHNGEILQNEYKPINKSKIQFLKELNKSFIQEKYNKKIVPMTLEGCVVRVSDIIAYIGRDIEDAILLKSIKRSDIPLEIVRVLGNNNSIIVDTIIKDIIKNSIGKDYLSFSKEVYNALIKLKDWNYKYIYNSKEACKNEDIIEEYFYKLYYKYLEYINQKTIDNKNLSKQRLYSFIKERSLEYTNNTSKERMIVDYISGQTDHYFLRECEYNFSEFDRLKLYN